MGSVHAHPGSGIFQWRSREIRHGLDDKLCQRQHGRAIATGPGISAWFTPADVEERKGGTITFRLGAGMDSTAEVTAWEPPHRFAYEERDWSPGAPQLRGPRTGRGRSSAARSVWPMPRLGASPPGPC